LAHSGQNTRPSWQLAVIAWGEKYPVAEINHLIATVLRLAAHTPHVVLISDRPRPGVLEPVHVVPFPDWALEPRFLKGGCQAKLAMFDAGVLNADMPTIYIDIDTVVLGDMTQFLALLEHPQHLAMLQTSLLPFGAMARQLSRMTGQHTYARGNSSILVFVPSHCQDISQRFRDLVASGASIATGPLKADDNFISWVAQDRIVVIPTTMAVKFPTEFMRHSRPIMRLRGLLPWVRSRWDGLLAITLPGFTVKPQALLALADGAEIRDERGRWLIWSDAALGSVRKQIITYYKSMTAA
jgi:hypothetical protein